MSEWDPDLIPYKAFLQKFGVSDSTGRRLGKKGELPLPICVGKKRFVRRETAEAFIASKVAAAAPAH